MREQRRIRAYFAARCRNKANPPSRVQLIADLLDEDDRASDAPKKKRGPRPSKDTVTRRYLVAREASQLIAKAMKVDVVNHEIEKRWGVKRSYVDKARAEMKAQVFSYSRLFDTVAEYEREKSVRIS